MDRKEAIEIVRKNWPDGRHQFSEALKTLIPELKESEDERIRKALILYIKYKVSVISGWRKEDLIAWLEKQKTTNEPSVIEFDSSHSNIITLPGCKNDIHAQIRQWLFDLVGSFIWHKDWAVGKADCLAWIASQQKPVEWSEEDKENFAWFDKFFRAESVIVNGRDIPQDKYQWFKSLAPQDHWKPSKTQIDALESAIGALDAKDDGLVFLYNDLKKLKG